MSESKETIVVVFGGTGDLMKLKIAPALFNLSHIHIIGCGRSEYTDKGYKELIKVPERFEDKVTYLKGDLQVDSFYTDLENKINEIKKGREMDVIIYFSIMPQLFPIVVPKLHNKKELKLIIEKPFGLDEQSAKTLNNLFLTHFSESQLFRVEHYLAKEIISQIPEWRIQHTYEQYFNKNYVTHIEVSLLERLDADKRGEFYDGVGTLRDVGQNHVLQMLALVACELGGNVGLSKEEFFKSSLNFNSEIDLTTFQYEGYSTVKGVKENSTTETAYLIRSKLVGKRWGGADIILEAGKAYNEVKKQVAVYFKDCPLGKIVFNIDTNTIEVWSQNPVESKTFEIGEKQKVQYIGEYTKLFTGAIRGEKNYFVSFSEVELMWRFTDQYVRYIKTHNLRPVIYRKYER